MWKLTSRIVCDPAIVIADDRRRQNHVLSSAIVCVRLRSSAIVHNARVILTLPLTEHSALRSSAIIWKQLSLRSSAICDLRSASSAGDENDIYFIESVGIRPFLRISCQIQTQRERKYRTKHFLCCNLFILYLLRF